MSNTTYILFLTFVFAASFFVLFSLVSESFGIAAFTGGVGCAIGVAIGSQSPITGIVNVENK